jgi:hypothetical protein
LEGAANTPGFGLVGLGDQGQEIGFFLTEWLLLLFLPQVAVDADITRSLVAAKIEPWKGAINLSLALSWRSTPIKRLGLVWMENLPRSVAIHLTLSFLAKAAVVPQP